MQPESLLHTETTIHQSYTDMWLNGPENGGNVCCGQTSPCFSCFLFLFVCLFVFWKKQTSNCNKVQGSRKEDEEVRGDEPQTGV